MEALLELKLFHHTRDLSMIYRYSRPDYISVTIQSDALRDIIHTTSHTVLCQHVMLVFCFFRGLLYQLLSRNNFKEIIFLIGWLHFDYAISRSFEAKDSLIWGSTFVLKL